MDGEKIKIKDLPVISNAAELNREDKIITSHVFDDVRATTSVTLGALIDYFIHYVAGSGNKRHFGLIDPSADLGTDGDLYFKYYEKTRTMSDVYVKYEGIWLNLKGG